MRALGSTRVLRGAAIATALCGAALSVSRSCAMEGTGSPDPLGDLGARIVVAEGGPAPNPLSSAAGYGQFLSGTWLEIFERAYPQVARTLSREQILALRDVKPLAEDLTNRYAQANAITLRSLGLRATAGELSLAHAVGPQGAVSVLTAEPARPAVELLGPQAVAANPVFKEMTASELRQWAAVRIGSPAGSPPPIAASAARPSLEPLGPTDEFRIDQGTKAPEARGSTSNPITTVQDIVDAISQTGDGKAGKLRPSTILWLLSVGVEPTGFLRGEVGAVRIFNRAASRAVLDAIHGVSDRQGFREFKTIEGHAGSRRELPRDVVRALAIALLDKVKGQTEIIRLGRSKGKASPRGVEPAVPRSVRDAANASVATAPPL